MRAPDRGARKGSQNWRDVWSRRSRLRSATRLLVEANAASPPPTAPLLSSESSAVVVLDGPADAVSRPRKRPRDTDGDNNDDDIVDPLYRNFLDQITAPAAETPAPAGTPADPVVIDDGGTPPKPTPRKESHDFADGEVVDPDYDLFLRHLRVEGESYVLEMMDQASGRLLRVKYEENDSCNVAPLRSEKDVSKVGSKKRTSTKSKEAKVGSKKRTSTTKRKEAEKRKRRPEPAEADAERSMVDADYQIFLKHVRVVNGLMVLELNNVTVRYEEDEDGGVGSEILDESNEEASAEAQGVRVKTEDVEEEMRPSNSELTLQTCSGSRQGSNFSACEDDGSSIIIANYKMPNFFAEGLSAILRKPFNKKEYCDLMCRATYHKAMEKIKVFRSETKSVATNKRGRSYLDYYPDLAEKIKCADPNRRLALLRGLFYYLENVVHKGSFIPWLNASSGYKMLLDGGNEMHPAPIEISEI